MCESPESLQNICVSYISRNVSSVFDEILDEEGNIIKYSFKSSCVSFPSILSEQLFSALDEHTMTDQLLSIFDPSITRLQRVYIRDASNVSTKGLRILRTHKITELAVIGLSSITVNDLIGCLGDWTLENLRVLNVSFSTFLSSERVRVVIALSKLRNLKCLDVSFTEFNSQALEIVAEDLPSLESLNISNTMVTDITPLKKCKDRLKCLNMYNIKINPASKCLNILSELHNLYHLDISEEKEEILETEMNSVSNAFSDFLKNPSCLPLLTSLDISGKNVDICSLKDFLKNHPQMKYLGLLEVQACQDDMFCKPTDPLFNRKLVLNCFMYFLGYNGIHFNMFSPLSVMHIIFSPADHVFKRLYRCYEVAGYATEEQILESLRRYMHREIYPQKCLCYLYSYIQNLAEVRLDIIKLVLQCMKTSPHLLRIQMAATACLYNLTRGALSTKIHTKWLKQIVDLTLISMENFPKQPQLQKNSLLTLCSDRMLQDVTFNRYHCAELVMNSLLAFDDPAMNRMSVAICSILTARITTAETSILGAKEAYMKRLLNIVKTKSEQRDIDIMMKFTLSALWNLSDESPKTCSVFLELGGMELFLEVLNRFPGESPVETKVLGLLNNIAEVNYLRPFLLKENFIATLKSLLHSEHIDVSYFAAGIVAHIASEGEEFWTCSYISWNDIVTELGEVVSNWEIPEMEMVAYRSFNPFYPLFTCFKAYQVQLWAAWAIHHVCSKNPKRYCHMIIEEGGMQILKNLVDNPEVHSSVTRICQEILLIVREEHPVSSQTYAQAPL